MPRHAPAASAAASAAAALAAPAPRAAASDGAPALPKALWRMVKEEAGLVTVRFWLQLRVEFGQSVRIIGGSEEMGEWALARGPAMAWSDGDLWNISLDLEAGGSGDGREGPRGLRPAIPVHARDMWRQPPGRWRNAWWQLPVPAPTRLPCPFLPPSSP
jgi:hypothetical protein